MINLEVEKSLALDAQERYDIISFAMDAADDNGFINSFVFERALYCYAAIMLYPELKEDLSTKVASNLISAWTFILDEGLFEKMIKNYETTLNILCQEAENWFKEYADWAHSARGILEMVQQFSGDFVQTAANRLVNTAQETRVSELLEVADEWGMTRSALKDDVKKEIPPIDQESLFE